MDRRCTGGTVIAVNVGGGGASGLARSNYWNYSGWGHLRHRLTSKSENKHVTNIIDILLWTTTHIIDILLWTTTLSSKRHLQQIVASGLVDLYLTPPVQGFDLLGFDAFEKLYEIGYEYTRERLETWEDLPCITYKP
jgi:predicted acylesterase/phospholipase RssA